MKAFNYGPEQVIARNEREARKILRIELGESRIVGMTRAKPPFLLADTDQEPFEVSEQEYCERVMTFGDGMVFRD